MTQDHNLLFGVFAVQLGKVTAVQIMDVAASWALDTSRDIPSRLLELNLVTEGDCELLQRFVDEAVAAHGGDVKQTLASFGGEEQVHQVYRGSIVLTADGQVSIPPTAKTPESDAPDGRPDDVSTVKGVFETPGRYTNSIEHARGGMGRVLLVHDDFLGRDIALKELLPHLGTTEASTRGGDLPTADGHPSPVRFSAHIIARFLQEARITGQLEHPSIVPVYELGHRKDGSLYYTMKLVRGQSLSKAIKECKNLEERLRLLPHFVDLCQAIAYAHSREIIHRDIKPANVMVGEFGETVVLDWGLAKKRDREDVHARELVETLHAMNLGDEVAAAKTAYGQVLGTPVYMAPEQAKGALEEVDGQSDVYALGVVLYEILTGDVPFEGKSTREVLEKVIAGNGIPIETRVKVVPPELAAIAAKAMARNKSTRYPDVKALAQEIERFQSGTIVKAHHYTILDYTRLLWKRQRTPIIMSAAALLLLVLLSAYYVNQVTLANQALTIARDDALAAEARENEARLIAEKRLYFSKISEANTHIQNGRFDLAQPILQEAPFRFRNWEWGYLLARCNQDRFTIDGGVTCVAYGPEGNVIATGFRDGTVALFDAASGEEQNVFDQHNGRLLDLAFSPDGFLLVTTSEDGLALVWSTLNSAKPIPLAGHEGSVTSCAVSPDGQRAVISDAAGWARLWNLHSGELLAELVGHEDTIHHTEFSPNGEWVLTAGMDWTARIWNSNSGVQVGVIQLQNPHVNAAFDPNGRFVLATSPGDPKTTLHKAPSGESLFSFPDTIDSVHAGRFGIQSNQVILQNGAVGAWSTETGEKTRDIHFHESQLSYVKRPSNDWLSYSRDRESLLSVLGNQLFVTALGYSETPRKYEGHSDAILHVIESPKGNELLTQSADGTAKLWGPDPDDRTYVVSNGTSNISASGRLTLERAAGRRGPLVVRETLTGRECFRIENMAGVSEMAILSPNGKYLLGVLDHGITCIWDVQTGNVLSNLAEVSEGLACAIFAPSVDALAVGYSNGVVSLLDFPSMKTLWSKSRHTAPIRSIRFSGSGEELVTSDESGEAAVWSTKDGETLLTLRYRGGRMNAAGFSPDGTIVWTASDDGVVNLWKRKDGNNFVTLESPEAAQSVALNSDNTRIVVRSSQSYIYDLETETRILSIPLRTSPVYSKDDRSLYVGKGKWLQAIPWEDMGTTADSVVQSVSSWKRKRAVRRSKYESIMNADQLRIVVRYIPEYLISRVIESIREFLSRLPADGQLHCGDDISELPYLLQSLGLEDNDRIEQINGTPWKNIEEPVGRIESILTYESNPLVLELRASSGARTRLIIRVAEDTAVTKQSMELPFESVVQILSEIAAILKQDYDFRERSGKEDRDFDGYGIASELPFLGKLGLKKGDFITAVDGKPITSLSKFIEIIEGAMGRIRNNEGGAVWFDLFRGEVGKMRTRIETIPP